MTLHWTKRALADLHRLHGFVAEANPLAATRVVQALAHAPERLIEFPRIGEQLYEFEPREVRRLLVGPYEMRYELRDESLYILRIWHTREQR